MLVQRTVLSLLDLRESALLLISFFSVLRNKDFEILVMLLTWIFQLLLQNFHNKMTVDGETAKLVEFARSHDTSWRFLISHLKEI
jgi:hypothetical protein